MSQETSSPESLAGASGSSSQWDDIWKQYSDSGDDLTKAYVKGATKTIIQFWQRCYFEDLIQCVCPKTDWSFLELASGRGTTSLYLASNGMKNITLLDLSETALLQAEANFRSEKLEPPKTIVGNAESTGLKSDQYDCIYNIGVLEHFEDPSAILAESLRLLKPGGKLFMPIVPQMPFSHSIICRTFFNPITLFKQAIKSLIGVQRRQNSEMVRTSMGARTYASICQSLGLTNVQCLPYNPYWRINRHGGWAERFVSLPIYKAHHFFKRSLGCKPSLRTLHATSLCLLLLAEKPVANRTA